MNHVKAGVGGRGTVMEMDTHKPHPASHYEIGEMRVKKAQDGSFVIHHHMQLKKRHMAKPSFETGWDARNPEPEVHTAADHKELMAHMKKHFAPKGVPATPQPDNEAEEAGEPDEEE